MVHVAQRRHVGEEGRLRYDGVQQARLCGGEPARVADGLQHRREGMWRKGLCGRVRDARSLQPAARLLLLYAQRHADAFCESSHGLVQQPEGLIGALVVSVDISILFFGGKCTPVTTPWSGCASRASFRRAH